MYRNHYVCFLRIILFPLVPSQIRVRSHSTITKKLLFLRTSQTLAWFAAILRQLLSFLLGKSLFLFSLSIHPNRDLGFDHVPFINVAFGEIVWEIEIDCLLNAPLVCLPCLAAKIQTFQCELGIKFILKSWGGECTMELISRERKELGQCCITILSWILCILFGFCSGKIKHYYLCYRYRKRSKIYFEIW